jgi:hypothetical protein
MKNKIIGILVSILLILTTIPAVIGTEKNDFDTLSSNSNHEDAYVPWKEMETAGINPKIQEIIEKINITLVRAFMESLVVDIGNRETGTEGCKEAAVYLYKQFDSNGLQTRYQNWSSWGSHLYTGFFRSQNVIGTHPGIDPQSDELIILNAHYDTIKDVVGAVDNAAGTVVVLAAAYVLSQYSFNRTIDFVAFSGEEKGLLGSHAYARALYDQRIPVLVEFNAEMLAKATSAQTGKTIRLSVTEDAGWIADTMKTMSQDYGLNFTISQFEVIQRDAKSGWSDYFEFTQLGYEALAVWPGEWDPLMHTPQDDMSNVNFSYLVNTTRHVAATIANLADLQIEQPQLSITNPRFGTIIVSDTDEKPYKYKTPILLDQTTITLDVTPGNYPIENVAFYVDDRLLFTDIEPPYEYLLSNLALGFHTIDVIASDTSGTTATDQMKLLSINI